VQTTESALNEVNSLLVGIRQLAIHAANEGANDFNMLEADQLEIRNALDSVNRISQMAQFGTRKLLDGSRGVNGVAAGKGLTFLHASTATKSSPETGYEVRVTQAASRAHLDAGEIPVDEAGNLQTGIELTIQENGKVARYTTKSGDDLNVVVNSLQREANLNGLELDIDPKELVIENGKPKAVGGWAITHHKYGSGNTFTVVSSVPGVLSKEEGVPELVNNGKDVQGTINYQLAIGTGNELMAAQGTQAEGLAVSYVGPQPEDPNIPVGRVSVSQNSLIFQVGPNAGQKVSVSLEKMSAQSLGRNVINKSNFQSLDDVTVISPQGAEDTMRLVEHSIDGVNRLRAQLGAIQKNALESQLRSLGVAREELTNAESVIRDADMAAELSEFVRNQVISQAGMAMLSQANQAPNNVLSLLRNAQ
jgi:flagellin